jgi:hypothetical protein
VNQAFSTSSRKKVRGLKCFAGVSSLNERGSLGRGFTRLDGSFPIGRLQVNILCASHQFDFSGEPSVTALRSKFSQLAQIFSSSPSSSSSNSHVLDSEDEDEDEDDLAAASAVIGPLGFASI